MFVELCSHQEEFFAGQEAFEEGEFRPLSEAFERFMDPGAPFIVRDVVGDDVQAALPAASYSDAVLLHAVLSSAHDKGGVFCYFAGQVFTEHSDLEFNAAAVGYFILKDWM